MKQLKAGSRAKKIALIEKENPDWQEQKVLALGKLCDEENLDKAQFKALIDTYIYNGQEPIKDDVFKCLDNRPSILKAREIGERILSKMKEFVQVFIEGMTG
ncbi:hypothetical protein [Cellulophaga sp. HaHa_2_95]|uniref:type I restriction endonuclease subunit R, EcoR124 family n=1 Tax=Cellulophaga sp. HaHa_2_95 TaxID=2745558 RepID=UPI002103F3B0|nr:hypothetical protein [Cellulophaga sp. HaHa_2_95]